MIQQVIGILLYIFTMVTTLALLSALPVVLVSLIIEHRRTHRNAVPIFIAVLVAGGYLIGGLAGWSFRPSVWKMSLLETAGASVNASKYGHELEHQAERVLFYFLTPGSIGSVAAGIAAATVVKLRLRAERRI